MCGHWQLFKYPINTKSPLTNEILLEGRKGYFIVQTANVAELRFTPIYHFLYLCWQTFAAGVWFSSLFCQGASVSCHPVGVSTSGTCFECLIESTPHSLSSLWHLVQLLKWCFFLSLEGSWKVPLQQMTQTVHSYHCCAGWYTIMHAAFSNLPLWQLVVWCHQCTFTLR